MFERLSVFAGGLFPWVLCSAVCGGEEAAEADAFDVLSSLVDKSLVVCDFDGERATLSALRIIQGVRA